MKLTRMIHEGEIIPFGYGYVRYDFSRDLRIFAPMPFNWIMRWSLVLWLWLLRKSIKPLTDEEIENHRIVQAAIQSYEFTKGIERYNAGYEVGFKSGWNTCVDNAMAQLDKERECRCASLPDGIYYGDCPIHKHDPEGHDLP